MSITGQAECRAIVGGILVAYTVVTTADDVKMVVTALGESSLVGLDVETTGLDPQRDRVRLISLDLDTCDGGRHGYLNGVRFCSHSPPSEARHGTPRPAMRWIPIHPEPPCSNRRYGKIDQPRFLTLCELTDVLEDVKTKVRQSANAKRNLIIV
jgi:hypothetical protein